MKRLREWILDGDVKRRNLPNALRRQQSDMVVENQTETLHTVPIFQVVKDADVDKFLEIVESDPHQLDVRGPVGETPLLMSFLFGHPKMKTAAREIIAVQPTLAQQQYTGLEYLGENALHISIVNKDFDAVRFLVETNPEVLKGRAKGTFFQDKDVQYGELPLFFAACTGQTNVVSYLVEMGADLTAVTETDGDTILHIVVRHNMTDMYDYLLQLIESHGIDKDLLRRKVNYQGFTPFTLSAHLGHIKSFQHLLMQDEVILWVYGPKRCRCVPIDELDTPWFTPKSNNSSSSSQSTALISSIDAPRRGALQTIVESEQLEVLMLPIVKELLKRKWTRFISHYFYLRCGIMVLYVIAFSVALISRTMMIADTIVVAGAVYKFSIELNEMRQSVTSYFSGHGCMFMENVASLLYCVSVFGAVVARSLNHSWLDDVFITLSALFLWSYVLWLLIGFRLTGPFVIMLGKMLLKDVLCFSLIYSAFLFGVSQAFYILFNEDGVEAFARRLQTTFLIMLGEFSLDDYRDTDRFPIIKTFVLILYLILVAVVLLNVLIAMMSSTYASISDDADRVWHLEWARIIFSIENEVSEAGPMSKYWIEINGKRYLQIIETDTEGYLKQRQQSSID
eukprot:PhF_6_TR31436/c0_g1_i3/m.46112/K04975/TRPV6; transient receptor potential cation channel subfamily V member 6